jgi:1-deoxy-D-xylulose-5-phosphate synthase
VFQSPHDAIIFDTGHQGYTHKILTGRAGRLKTLNSFGGLSRFLTRAESQHDPIDASHGGTALSLGMGIAIARNSRQDSGSVVCVVGDGSICEGMALEALNHLVTTKARVILVLNDNDYAISPSSGAIHNALKDTNGAAKALFNALGYRYLGPVDGHHLPSLIEALEQARCSTEHTVVHVKTIKGFGWNPADTHPYRFHFSFPFDKESGTPSIVRLRRLILTSPPR